jgi:hypothetical protein
MFEDSTSLGEGLRFSPFLGKGKKYPDYPVIPVLMSWAPEEWIKGYTVLL